MAAESPHAGSWIYPGRYHSPIITRLDLPKEIPMSSMKLSTHEALIRAVCETYADDKLAPAVVASYIDGRGNSKLGYYASIRRFPTTDIGASFVVCNIYGAESPDAAIRALAVEWERVSNGNDFRGKLKRVLAGEAVYR